MRKRTVKSGLKFMLAALILVTAATFFPGQVAELLFLGWGGDVRVTFVGFFLAGLCGGCGVLITAIGLLQVGGDERGVRLFPTIFLLFSLVVVFCVLAYSALSVPKHPPLPQGESITI